jgi:hypothetical protein
MSWAFCNTRNIKKTRKPHRCIFCGRTIPEGTENVYNWSGLFEGNFQNSYSCHWCEEHQSRLIDDYDSEILDFWDCLREDIFQDKFRRFKDCDCVDERGMTGSIEATLKGDYLIFECDTCKKEWHREYMPIA